MNTGNKQAVIAYKVTPNGQPVDVDGQLTSVSGKRQAIALLQGQANPNVLLYEVEYYYGPRGLVNGTPTTEVDLAYCPVSIFVVDQNYLILHPGNIDDVINIFATFGWALVAPVNFATVTPNTGAANSPTSVVVARTATLGQGYIDFRDLSSNEIKRVYVINTDALGWILETGFWNDLRFWDAVGPWKSGVIITLPNTNLGLLNNDGTILTSSNSNRNYVFDNTAPQYTKIRYKGYKSVTGNASATPFASLLAKNNLGVITKLIGATLLSDPRVEITEEYTLPANTVTIYIGWANRDVALNSTVELRLTF